jgi:3-deoxy-D-manno-octulosonate 8-phosphate phosphatase (KDO 8-P phosphatase)
MNPVQINEKCKRIKFLALDVDGVLTDGRVWWIESTGWTRSFNIQDGYGIKLLQKSGIQTAFISGGDSHALRERAKWLKVEHTYLGNEEKIDAWSEIKKETGFEDHQIAYVGDELFDVPLLKRAGFSATPPHAVDEVKETVHYVTKREGGYGAVREVVDLIRHAQGLPNPYEDI